MAPTSAVGWRITGLPDVVYPGIVEGDGTTSGFLLSGLTSAEWGVIDAFEDDIYDLRLLGLIDERRGWAYTWPVNQAPPQVAAWRPEDFAERHLAAYVTRCGSWLARYRSNEDPAEGTSSP